jgi:hypothetical protein
MLGRLKGLIGASLSQPLRVMGLVYVVGMNQHILIVHPGLDVVLETETTRVTDLLVAHCCRQ